MTTLILPVPLPAEYVDELINEKYRFYSYEMYDDELDVGMVVQRCALLNETAQSLISQCVRSLFDLADDTYGLEDKHYNNLPPSIWWMIRDGREDLRPPYEFGEPLVAVHTDFDQVP